MKKIFLLITIVSICMISKTFGQSELTDKYYYAEVLLSEQPSTGITIIPNFGKDYPSLDEKKEEIIIKVKEFTNGVDIMNYMSDLGWEYVGKQVQWQYGINKTAITRSYYTFRKIKQKK